jgi:predicted transcriptional regulator
VGKTSVKQPSEAGEDTVWVSFRIAKDYAKKIDEIAAREDRSRASVVRRILVKEFTTREKATV